MGSGDDSASVDWEEGEDGKGWVASPSDATQVAGSCANGKACRSAAAGVDSAAEVQPAKTGPLANSKESKDQSANSRRNIVKAFYGQTPMRAWHRSVNTRAA